MRFFSMLFSPVLGVLRSLFDPTRWFELPRRLGRLSSPTLAALGTLLFLSVCLLAVALKVLRDDSEVGLFWKLVLPMLVALVLGISAVVYYAVYLWLLPEYETFDDIHTAWNRGLAELERQGLDLYDLPLFLILGGASPDRVQQLLQASGLEWTLANYPAGPGALQWYAGREAVFVVCQDVGCLTQMAVRATQRLAAPVKDTGEVGISRTIDLSRTCWPSENPDTLDGAAGAGAPPQDAAGPAVSARDAMNLCQTLDPSAGDMSLSVVAADGERPSSDVTKQRLALSRDERNEQLARCEHLGRLIVAARQPRAPLNGILTLLPLNMILCDASEGADIQEAASLDLRALVHCLRVRCPTYAIVTDWEDDLGFQELVKRLSAEKPDRSSGKKTDRPFGKGNRPGDAPTPDRLEAVAKNAVAAFEDFIYQMFKQPDALTKPGNRPLYALLCKVRRYLNPRVVKIVADGYSCDERQQVAPLFGGCYFTAAGRKGPSQAFVRGVFKKIVQQHKELEWTAAALGSDRFCRRTAFAGFTLALGLVTAAIVLVHRSLQH